MALLDKGLKQRMVGALVLVALAVIFLPMLFSRQDEPRQVVVEVPAMPQAPLLDDLEVIEAPVLEPQELAAQEFEPVNSEPVAALAPEPVRAAPQAAAAAVAAKPEASRLDANRLPISWSVQMASLSSRSGAESLQKTLRAQGYNAYIRTFDGMNRVFVGPVIERAEAERLRDQLNRQHKLTGFVVRFQPEAS